MPLPDTIYDPHEDSYLLLETLLKYLNNKPEKIKICEVGIGSGYISFGLAKKYPKHEYYGTDINPDALEYTKQEFIIIDHKISLTKTDILKGITEKFDLIIFNTPYLPTEKNEKYEDLSLKEKTIYGGKKGYEIIDRFIIEINDNLEDNGEAVMLFSSHSNLKHIEETLENNFFEYEIIAQQTIFFEELHVMKFSKSKIIKELSTIGATQMRYIARGKHSKILEAKYKNKDVVIKIGDPKDIQIEEIFLKKLQKYDFVPKLYHAKKDYVIMQHLKGVQLKSYFTKKRTTKEIAEVFNNIISVTMTLDKLGINKFELTNPIKHIFINEDNSVKFIDFERTLHTPKPKNTTQILEFIKRKKREFEEQGINIDEKKIFDISSRYKKKPFEIKFEDFLKN